MSDVETLTPLSLDELRKSIATLPVRNLRPLIRERRQVRPWVIAVLDDDPTGTQTVYDANVYLSWTVELLVEEMREGPGLFFLLTNSRALPEVDAVRLAVRIGQELNQAAIRAGQRLLVVSRSDSTLRGHYPAEVDALAEGLGMPDAAHLIAPFFAEGGRLTFQDVHYVREGDLLIPSAQTPFARDPAFGYRHSRLPEWLVEKTGGRRSLDQIASISLAAARTETPTGLRDRFLDRQHRCFLLNAVEESDLEAPILGLLDAVEQGRNFIFRTAAGFVRALAGLDPRDPLAAGHLASRSGRGGLIVAGSYVPKTSAQLAHLQDHRTLPALPLEVRRVLQKDPTEYLIRLSREIDTHLSADRCVLLYTSRELVAGESRDESLRLHGQVSDALVRVVSQLTQVPRFLLAKGGITSSELARVALHTREARVLGQILPGVPVWRLGDSSRWPGLLYIVFPGNVGQADSLTEALGKLL